jgi:hypothetical protein
MTVLGNAIFNRKQISQRGKLENVRIVWLSSGVKGKLNSTASWRWLKGIIEPGR